MRYTIHDTNHYSSILFVDTHVKWMRAFALPSFAVRPGTPPAHRPRRRAGQPQAPATHAAYGYVMHIYAGNTLVDSGTISEADMMARRDFMAASSASHPDPQLSQARFLAGLTPVQGPGVVVTLNDSKKHLPAIPPGMASPNIIHDSDINAVINELKAAGAEAVTVNNQRLVATSSIRCMGPTVFINGRPLMPPFAIKAIGSPKALTAVMNVPGGIAAQLRSFDPSMFSVKQIEALRLPAYSGGSEPRYAKPASFNAPPAANGKGAGETLVASSAGGTAGKSQAAKRQQRLKARFDITQTKLTRAEQAFFQAKQELGDEIRAALPQAPTETLAGALDLETRIGGSISSLQYATEYKAWCRKKHNPKSYAGAAQWKVKAERDLRPLLAEEANLFPRTAQVRPHILNIHALAVQLRDRRMEIYENRALASAEASLLRTRNSGTL